MELWIRSQDKEKLVRPTNLKIEYENELYVILSKCNYRYRLGYYKTKERALEVLDEIQKRIAILTTFDLFGLPNNDMAKAYRKALGDDNFESASYPYQMPLE